MYSELLFSLSAMEQDVQNTIMCPTPCSSLPVPVEQRGSQCWGMEERFPTAPCSQDLALEA